MGLIGNDTLNDLFINSPLQAPQAIISLSNKNLWAWDLKTGFLSSKSKLSMFNFKNFCDIGI